MLFIPDLDLFSLFGTSFGLNRTSFSLSWNLRGFTSPITDACGFLRSCFGIIWLHYGIIGAPLRIIGAAQVILGLYRDLMWLLWSILELQSDSSLDIMRFYEALAGQFEAS